MAGEGQKLRIAREQKGWSLEEAEEATKIRVRYLKALEEERYDVIPGTAYVKGFLRTYANHLGLNPDEILADYKASCQPEPIPPIEPPLKPIKSRSLWLRPTAVVIMAIIAIVAVIGIANILKEPEGVQSQYNNPQLPTPPETVIPENESPNVVEEQKQEPVQEPVVEGLVAKVFFSQDCWISMRIDGGEITQMTYRAGTSEEFKAKDKIEFLSIGNAGGIKINLNGKDLPPVGKSWDVVNNYVLTKETLNTISQ